MLKPVKEEITKSSIADLCQTNELFAAGALRQLCNSDLCLFEPSMANNFSQTAFKFPLDTNDNFLSCILDCADCLGSKKYYLNRSEDENDSDGYTIFINDPGLIQKLVYVDCKNIWCTAGAIFVDFNKHKKQGSIISITSSTLFEARTIHAMAKHNYLLL